MPSLISATIANSASPSMTRPVSVPRKQETHVLRYVPSRPGARLVIVSMPPTPCGLDPVWRSDDGPHDRFPLVVVLVIDDGSHDSCHEPRRHDHVVDERLIGIALLCWREVGL